MDYEKKYKEVLEKAKSLLSKEWIEEGQDSLLETIFPELKESEGERIRKEIIEFIKKRDRSGCDYDYAKWIAWLEKQGENKQSLANSAKTCKKSQRMVSAEAKEALYDKPAWSEEDEEYLRRTIKATKEIYPATSNWLKSIKQRIKGE